MRKPVASVFVFVHDTLIALLVSAVATTLVGAVDAWASAPRAPKSPSANANDSNTARTYVMRPPHNGWLTNCGGDGVKIRIGLGRDSRVADVRRTRPAHRKTRSDGPTGRRLGLESPFECRDGNEESSGLPHPPLDPQPHPRPTGTSTRAPLQEPILPSKHTRANHRSSASDTARAVPRLALPPSPDPRPMGSENIHDIGMLRKRSGTGRARARYRVATGSCTTVMPRGQRGRRGTLTPARRPGSPSASARV